MLTVAACGRLDFERVALDAAPDSPPPCSALQFAPPIAIAELDTSATETDATLRLRDDELQGLFWSDRAGGLDIFQATRPDLQSPFVVSTADSLNSPVVDLDPAVGADGSLVVLASSRAGGAFKLYESTRSGSDFTTPVLLGISSMNATDQQPYIVGTELYFSSDRSGVFQIYHATRLGPASYTAPVMLGELDATADQHDPVVSADRLTLFWRTNDDIWTATRAVTTDPFGNFEPVANLNDPAGSDGPNWLSTDGCRMYMSSDRDRPGAPHIYVATR